jgi:hypothetical protein
MNDLYSGSTAKLELLRGEKIVKASSSLSNFSIEFESGLGLSVDAIMDDEEVGLQLEVIDSSDLAEGSDAVCAVDWTWICKSVIKNLSTNRANPTNLRLELDPVGPLAISVGLWQGKPFLSFQPYKAPLK